MMKLRPYRVYQNNKWWSFNSLYQACIEFAARCHRVGLLDFADNGDLVETIFMDKLHYKRYKVVCLVPYTEIEIRKMSKGDIDLTQIKNYIKDIKEKYYV